MALRRSARFLLWTLAGLLTAALIVLAFLPAAWMAAALERQTGGRLTLGDAQGTLWRGSAFIGGAPSSSDPVMPLLPGRFSWTLSPLVLVGQVHLRLENPAALSQPVMIDGSWQRQLVSPAQVVLPAERLAGLGAPLNTIQPSGRMRLSWGAMQVERQGQAVGMHGNVSLRMEDIASRLSPVKPLGAYLLTMHWQGSGAELALQTLKGPMLLNGAGKLVNGRVQFSGTAQAEAGQEERLANLLNLLGRRREAGDKNVIALEFK